MKKNTFPNFKKFEPEDFKKYQSLLYSLRQHADYTINNLLVWDEGSKGIEFSWVKGNILFKITDSIYHGKSKKPHYMLVGKKSADATLSKIFNSGVVDKLVMVPDYFVKGIKSKKFNVSEDKLNNDYILDVHSLLTRRGKRYANFRHRINYFTKKYGDSIETKDLDLLKTADVKLIVNSIHGWTIRSYSSKGNDPDKHDGQAIDKLLKIQNILLVKHKCIGVFINGKLEGISIYQIPHAKDKIAIGNHIKYNADFNRIFDFLVYITANKLYEQGVTKLNAMQDMGVEGIKNHKADFSAVEYYKKYTISPW